MKRAQVRQIWQILNSPGLATRDHNLKFSYGIGKNVRLLRPEMESFEEALKNNEKYQEYDTARIALAKEMAAKDPSGNPVKENNNFIMEDQAKFEAELRKLQEGKYKEAWDEYMAMMEEEIQVDFYKMHLNTFPDKIAPALIEALMDLIKEGNEEKSG